MKLFYQFKLNRSISQLIRKSILNRSIPMDNLRTLIDCPFSKHYIIICSTSNDPVPKCPHPGKE